MKKILISNGNTDGASQEAAAASAETASQGGDDSTVSALRFLGRKYKEKDYVRVKVRHYPLQKERFLVIIERG